MKITRIESIPVDVPIDASRAIVGSRGGHTKSGGEMPRSMIFDVHSTRQRAAKEEEHRI